MAASKETFMAFRELDEMASKPISKNEIGSAVERIVKAVDSGHLNPLDAVAALTAIDAVVKDAKAAVMEAALDEFAKHGQREVEVNGAKISRVETGVRYDYSRDPVWADIKDNETAWAERRNEVEATLKTLKIPTEMQEGDEMITRMPPIKTSTTTLKVTIK